MILGTRGAEPESESESPGNEPLVGVGVGVDQTALTPTQERFVLVCNINRLCGGEFACTFWEKCADIVF